MSFGWATISMTVSADFAHLRKIPSYAAEPRSVSGDSPVDSIES
jgi:hypothetical protein